MQKEIKKTMPVPGADGCVTEPGFARDEVLAYTRENVKAPWFRRKEWDYYLVTTDTFAVAFTISDLGYVGLLSASFIDFVNKSEHTETEITVLPRGRAFGLGTSTGDAHAECHTKRLDLVFSAVEGHRHISCKFRGFHGSEDLSAELNLYEECGEAMYIATPWKEKPTAFYYNCKKNCLSVSGKVFYGDRVETLTRDDAMAVLDWGRGVWTYDNTWYWGTGSGRLHNGEPFGFNLGYGFSDRSSATENCLYYGGTLHKLGEVTFGIPEKDGARDLLSPWQITSDDGRFEATFTPILDRSAFMDYKVILSDQHQVFGRMNGFAVTDGGEKLEMRDFVCALEVVRNKY